MSFQDEEKKEDENDKGVKKIAEENKRTRRAPARKD